MNIAKILAHRIGWDFEALSSQSRTAYLVSQRRCLMIVLKDLGHSQTEIGKMLNRDHSSVAHMISDKYFLLTPEEIRNIDKLKSIADDYNL